MLVAVFCGHRGVERRHGRRGRRLGQARVCRLLGLLRRCILPRIRGLRCHRTLAAVRGRNLLLMLALWSRLGVQRLLIGMLHSLRLQAFLLALLGILSLACFLLALLGLLGLSLRLFALLGVVCLPLHLLALLALLRLFPGLLALPGVLRLAFLLFLSLQFLLPKFLHCMRLQHLSGLRPILA